MIDPENVCNAAQIIAASDGLQPLYEELGIDETTLAHMVEHMLALGIDIQIRSFCLGALMALLASSNPGMTLTDHDITELLRPLP